MKIAGSYTLAVPQERAYALLQDPSVLARCMPGCERLELVGPDEYAMKMKMVLAAVNGLFDGTVKITDAEPFTRFRLNVEGKGKIGWMRGGGLLDLSVTDTGTKVAYDGDVQVGGTIAAVGQRLIDTTSRMMIKRFFDKLASEAGAAGAGA